MQVQPSMCENCREREQSMGLQESENCDKDQSTESCGPQPMFLPLRPSWFLKLDEILAQTLSGI